MDELLDINSIFIVEDDSVDQIMYQRYITRIFHQDMKIIMKTTGQDALAFLKDNPVDCILLDYDLPDMTGLEITKRIFSDCAINKNTPIVMLTGHGSEQIAVKALQLSIYDYYTKENLTPNILYNAIANAVKKSKLMQTVKKQEIEIKFMAYHDILTGVSNRAQFHEFVQKTLEHAHRYNTHIAILFLDVDHFKNINDTYGHEIGDLLLQEVAKRLTIALRKSDTIARLGGDEFTVLVNDINTLDAAQQVATKLLTTLRETFYLKENKINISASIGIALYPEAGNDVIELINNADKALYVAKEMGRDTICNYTEKLNTQTIKTLHIENFLRDTLQEKKFYLLYQPIFDIQNNTLYGVEALLRWNDPQSFAMTYAEVMSIAESSGLIIPIGEWVIETAFTQYQRWKQSEKRLIKLSINISPKQMDKNHWFLRAKDLLTTLSIDPELIIFEFTESTIVHNFECAVKTLNVFHQAGCQIFLDNFCTGFSSLNLIQKLPVTGLKIDRTFIQSVEQDSKYTDLIKAIFTLAEKMNLVIVSTGVENVEQFNLIRSFSNTQKIQGFHLSKPVDADEIQKLLYKHNKDRAN